MREGEGGCKEKRKGNSIEGKGRGVKGKGRYLEEGEGTLGNGGTLEREDCHYKGRGRLRESCIEGREGKGRLYKRKGNGREDCTKRE